MKAARLSVVLLAAAACCRGQSGPLPRFDVVSVKPSAPRERGSVIKPQVGGYWAVQRMSATSLVTHAFGLSDQFVLGLPAWANRTDYDIQARMPPSTTAAQFELMLRGLLVDRFQMHWHRETRPTDVSILTADAPGPDLRPASGHCRPPGEAPTANAALPCGQVTIVKARTNGVEIAGSSVTLGDLAAFLSFATVRPVLDETGSKQTYDFDVTLPVPARVAGETQDQMLFDSEKETQRYFRKQLGLNLDLTKTVKRPMPVVVIDHLAPASAN